MSIWADSSPSPTEYRPRSPATSCRFPGRIRKLKDKLGEALEFRLAFDGELPGSEGGVVVLDKMLRLHFVCRGGASGFKLPGVRKHRCSTDLSH